jgi:hypothetical protein
LAEAKRESGLRVRGKIQKGVIPSEARNLSWV